MIQTDKQRRWWFAQHPEYSDGRSGAKGIGKRKGSSQPKDRSSEKADAHERKALAYAERLAATLLEYMKLNSWAATLIAMHGSMIASLDEPPSKPPEESQEKETRKGFLDDFWDALEFGVEHPWYGGGGIRRLKRAPKGPPKGGKADKSAKPAGPDLKSGPPRPPIPGEPGKWVEVSRGLEGMEHQAKMSDQPFRASDGKCKIWEYEVNGTKFDDFRDGVLYEYKKEQTNFIDKQNEFHGWFKGALADLDQAQRQVKAAKGIPIVWRVGQRRVEAYTKLLRGFKEIKGFIA